ncbi:MAG: cupin domain-containing protein [Bacteroidia bacterium]|nr:cupin domain-containing protein [Bacteroidia bacterium]
MNVKVFGIILFYFIVITWGMKSQIHINTDSIGNKTATENIYLKNIAHDTLSSGFVIIIKKEVKLHKHLHHSEYIVVLDGEAKMQLGDKEFVIKKNDIVFIPRNTAHKVITTSKKPLKVISIQSPYFDGKDRVMLE